MDQKLAILVFLAHYPMLYDMVRQGHTEISELYQRTKVCGNYTDLAVCFYVVVTAP